MIFLHYGFVFEVVNIIILIKLLLFHYENDSC